MVNFDKIHTLPLHKVTGPEVDDAFERISSQQIATRGRVEVKKAELAVATGVIRTTFSKLEAVLRGASATPESEENTPDPEEKFDHTDTSDSRPYANEEKEVEETRPVDVTPALLELLNNQMELPLPLIVEVAATQTTREGILNEKIYTIEEAREIVLRLCSRINEELKGSNVRTQISSTRHHQFLLKVQLTDKGYFRERETEVIPAFFVIQFLSDKNGSVILIPKNPLANELYPL